MNLKVLRNGKTEQVSVKLGEFPSKQERASIGKDKRPRSALEGVTVENVTPDMAQQLKLSAGDQGRGGGRSKSVEPRRRSGIETRRRDSGSESSASEECRRISQRPRRQAKDEPVLLLVNREGTTLFLTV